MILGVISFISAYFLYSVENDDFRNHTSHKIELTKNIKNAEQPKTAIDYANKTDVEISLY